MIDCHFQISINQLKTTSVDLNLSYKVRCGSNLEFLRPLLRAENRAWNFFTKVTQKWVFIFKFNLQKCKSLLGLHSGGGERKGPVLLALVYMYKYFQGWVQKLFC